MTSDSAARSGIDLRFVDQSIRPQDDLFGHVNGKWLAEHTIPDDRSSDGVFRELRDAAEANVREIVEGAVDEEGDTGRIARLYESFMDLDRIEELGTAPLQPLLQRIEAVATKAELAHLLGQFQQQGLIALFGAYVNTDAKDSSRYLVYLTQSGLGLPDEAYYREDAHEEVRGAYVEHLRRLATLVGLDDDAGSVMDLETAIADASWDRVTNRDPIKTYNPSSIASLSKSAPDFEWDAWVAGIGATDEQLVELIVRQPGFVTAVARLWRDRPLEQWKSWMALHVASACAPYLTGEIVEENFDFYGRTLSGTPRIRERWKRGVSLVEGALGEAVGKIYVSEHFPETARDHMSVLVGNLVQAYRQSITDLDWMSGETRERALDKLDQFTPKVGYPDEWKDYSSLDISADDLLGNVVRIGTWSSRDDFDKLGRPVDRGEWFMTPQTVNAYYNPLMNEIVFPAAILQPPMFDPDCDDAANYGGIGAVIGHEIGHGFDDQGSQFDGHGHLENWWTDDDRAEFTRRARQLIDQFDHLSPPGLPDHKVNGALTVGENIGDLGGLTIAIKAYELALDGQEAPVIDGLTGPQRVLFGWAQVWRTKLRDAEALRLLSIDPHSPPSLRCNAIVANLDTFHDAFDCDDTDSLFRPVADRVRIW